MNDKAEAVGTSNENVLIGIAENQKQAVHEDLNIKTLEDDLNADLTEIKELN